MKGIKYDHEKPRWDLLPLDLVEPIVQIMTFGAKKYEPDNWQKVPDGKRRYFAALMRHIVAYQGGESTDPESGLSHLACAGFNILCLIWHEKQEQKLGSKKNRRGRSH